jgi:hypothetical protein
MDTYKFIQAIFLTNKYLVRYTQEHIEACQ